MDRWVLDGSLFISRKLESPKGVVQVYRCWSLDTPMGDNSFSLIGETSIPSEIAPSTVWGQRDYLRLIEFLEVNSAMVNVLGHVILRSLVKSLQVGRADGPETYWRCLDVLPMQAFSLVRPADTHGAPQFLITGGDVLASTTPTPTPAKVIVDVGDWKGKYDKLEAEFKQLKLEVSTLKDTLAGVSDTLIDSQSENEKLVREIEDQISANKQIQATLTDVEVERDSFEASLGDTLSENKKLTRKIEGQKSANKQLGARIRDAEGERQKAVEEAEKLKMKVSKLDIQVRESVSKAVLNDTVEREMDRWAAHSGSIYLEEVHGVPNTVNYVPVNELFIGNYPGLTNYHKVIDFNYHGKWSFYRNGYDVLLRRDSADPADPQGLRINRSRIAHEDASKSGRLFGMFRVA